MTEQSKPSSMNEEASLVPIISPIPEDEMAYEDPLLAELYAIGADSVSETSCKKSPIPLPKDEMSLDDRLLAELNSIRAPDEPTDEQPAAPDVDHEPAKEQVSEPTAEHDAASPSPNSALPTNAADNVVPLAPLTPAASTSATDSVMLTAMSPTKPAVSMPDGFALFSDGIYEIPADDTADPVFVCSPLRVDAIFHDLNGKGSGKLISLRNGNGDWVEIPVFNASMLRRPTEVIAKLIDHGLELAWGKEAKDSLLVLLNAWKPAQRLRTVPQLGWVDDSYRAFTLGSNVISASDVLALAPATGIATGLVTKGTAEDWKAKVGTLCRDNPLMILAVSLAFSGPLLAPLGLNGGGLHFRGVSSSGKTTLLHLAASVWGDRRLITQWRATSSGLEAIAATLNDMLVPLDEIAEIPARDLHEAIYMLANGTGKARMTKDVVLADQARWRLALISSGEISVEEKLREARLGAMAGHEVRLIDVEADCRTHGAFDNLNGAASAAEFADTVLNAVQDYHGAPGRVFVERLIGATSGGFGRVHATVSDLARKWTSELPSAPDGQITRVARRFSTIAVAGTLATNMGLTGWMEHAARDAARQAFLDWYDHRYGTKREAVADYVTPLKDFLTANLNALPDPSVAQSASVTPLGWCDATHAYLPVQTWSSIFAGADGTKAARALIDMQLMQPGEKGRLMRKAPRAIPGRPRLYTVNIARVRAYKPD
ncbi:DUF927 domain-containing protein [Rhodobacteraceae bacterium 2376]|uniref:DUF927 domain-containing protein n=1 Tax=Rhabdonatronobacter sediminivivens TaxID=2743469 RepID=A0A7Z0I228_9RHOB|nr:DUF927 domain-containing protein [Rhabdonatronobacter sediminivivens]NYS26395.1 DUF927 domain-containing protein [Rhabdonatronobacter sediminivivens]